MARGAFLTCHPLVTELTTPDRADIIMILGILAEFVKKVALQLHIL